MPRAQLQFAITPAIDHVPRLDRRGRRGEDHGHLLEPRPHHRHVAGMVLDPVLLLEARLMRLVDHDQAEPRIGQEQRRARAHHHLGLAARDPAPRPPPLRGAQIRMPRHRRAAEAGGEALQERLGQRDFGQQHQHLPVLPQRLGHRLEIDFGLARSRDAVEQHRIKSAADRPAQAGRRLPLLVAEIGRREGGIGHGQGLVRLDPQPLDRPRLDQPAQHRVADPRVRRKLADRPLPSFQPLERLAALRGHARRQGSRGAIFRQLACPLKRGGGRQHHPQHCGQRTQIIIRRPLAQSPQRRADRGHVDQPGERPQPIVANLLARQPLGLPRHPDQLPRPKRRHHHAARLDRHAVGHAIVERSKSGVQGDDTGAGEGHRGALGQRPHWNQGPPRAI